MKFKSAEYGFVSYDSSFIKLIFFEINIAQAVQLTAARNLSYQ